MISMLSEIGGVTVYGPSDLAQRGGTVSFTSPMSTPRRGHDRRPRGVASAPDTTAASPDAPL